MVPIVLWIDNNLIIGYKKVVEKIKKDIMCVFTWALAREDLFAILGTFEPCCMDPPCLAS